MQKINNIFITIIALLFAACSSDDSTSETGVSTMRLNYNITLHDGDAGTRAMGDPGVAEMHFVKPAHLYVIAVLNYADGKTFISFNHNDNAQPSWSDLNQDAATGDDISTYSGSIAISTGNVTGGKIYAFASPYNKENLNLSFISICNDSEFESGMPIEIDNNPNFEALTFDIPSSVTGEIAINQFFRSLYNTPSTGCDVTPQVLDSKAVSVVLYHTATHLDIQWDGTLSSNPATTYSSISIKELPQKGIHAFTPRGNSVGDNNYSHNVTINEGNKYMGRASYYVPSLNSYTLSINSGSDIAKGTNLTTGLTTAPWVRINLK